MGRMVYVGPGMVVLSAAEVAQLRDKIPGGLAAIGPPLAVARPELIPTIPEPLTDPSATPRSVTPFTRSED